MTEKTNIKIAVHNACKTVVQDRVLSYQQAIGQAQESASSDTKSTAGDKHETGRAMAHLEQEKNAKQLAEAQQQLNIINRINPTEVYNQVVLGSLVFTNKGNFYISVSAGKIEIDNNQFIAISLQSPIGMAMVNHKKEQKFIMNNQEFVIEDVF